jgi:hypothetical protein
MTELRRSLTRRATELLDASTEERIAHVRRPLFISYPRAIKILDELEQLLTLPKYNRPPNLLIIGKSNNGKSEILREFKRRHPAQERPDGDVTFAPVLFLQAPPGPDEKQLLDSALRQFNITPLKSHTTPQKLEIFIEQLRSSETRVVLVDELHSILAGSTSRQLHVLNTLKYISNETGVSMVFAGTEGARDALATDRELQSRFPERPLPRWKHKDIEYRRLLAQFEMTLPLRTASGLKDAVLAEAVFELSEGYLGGIAEAVREAAIQALTAGEEAITISHLDRLSMQRKGHRDDSEAL